MTLKKPITKAVIVAAGFGTRFLPATKNQPKEMLPIIDKPIIHYAVEEAVASGIKDIILVTRFGSHIMEDYFDNRYELEAQLEQAGKTKYLEIVKNIPQMANFVYVRQRSHLPYGNGSPLLAVKNLIDPDEAIVYMFGDDLTISNTDKPITKQLMDVFEEQQASVVVGVQEVPEDEVYKYGTVKYKKNPQYKYEIEHIYEKLPKGQAPSNMAQFGRFVLSYDAFEKAGKTKLGKDNELWLTDINNAIAADGKKVIAQPIDGYWYTTGDPLAYLKATYKFAMQRKDLKDEFLQFLRENISA